MCNLFVFVYFTLFAFLLLHYLITSLSLLRLQTKLHLNYFVYHSPTRSFY